MKAAIGTKIGIGYGLVLLTLLLVGAVSFRNLRQLNEDSRWVVHTVQVLQSIERLSGRVTEAESNERGYLLTQSPAFLQRFEELKPLVAADIQALRKLTSDNPIQQKRLAELEPIIGERVGLLEKVVHLFQAQGKMGAGDKDYLLQGRQDMGAFRAVLDEMAAEEQHLLDDRRTLTAHAEEATSLTILWGTGIGFLLVAVAGFFIVRGITAPLRVLTDAATRIGAGDYGQRAEVRGGDEVGLLAAVFNKMAAQVEQRQQSLAEQEWLKGNLARVTAFFQGQRDLASVCRMLASEIAVMLGAQRAAFYLAEEFQTGQTRLRWRAGYASAEAEQTVQPGEGLVGQCFVEKKPLFLNQLPPGYLKIKSALGEAVPGHVALLPILFEGEAKGVVEVASFQDLRPIQQEFLLQLLGGVGAVLNTIEGKLRTEELLQQAQVLSEELQSQQEELRQANEELQQTNQELGQANSELEERTERLDEQRVEMERKNREIEAAQRELEEKAAQLAQTSKYKSEFLANMSHELRTPLNSLLILSQILMENSGGNLTPKQIQYAKTIRGAGNELLELINDILDLAKIESGTVYAEIGDLSFAELAEAVGDSFRPQAEKKRLEFRIELDPALPPSIRTDVRRVQQVVKNLLSNAFKFTEQGSIMLRMGTEPEGVVLSVQDTGVGIPADKQQVIFEAFRQVDAGTARKYGGTGLGLSISREIAHLLGGSLGVASVPGEGSTFSLHLPAELAAAPSPAPAAPPAEPEKPEDGFLPPEIGLAPDDRASIRPGDRVLLIVEDDANFARLLSDFAHRQEFKVAVTGRAGNVSFLAEKLQPAAIILDIHLGDQEGWIVLDRLKNSPATRHIPVHIMSAQDTRERGLRLGAVSCLRKPVSRDQIEKVLGQVKEFAARSPKHLLIVEDDATQRQGLVELIGNGDVVATAVGTGAEALGALKQKQFDCLILDLGLPDIDGLELIRRIKQETGGAPLPIIIYTGRSLTPREEAELQQLSEAIIIKDVKSPERLLDETALFLHRVQSRLPETKRRVIEQARKDDSVLAGRTVLVVDDDPRNVFAVTAALEQYRMRVLYANTGREGLEVLEQNPDIAAVLMDIMMPEMDGFEAMRRIRADARHRRLPILAITAKAMKEDREKCIQAGASDYITKPVDMEHLRCLLRVWLYQ